MEPIVRCTLDGKMSAKDRLRLRKEDRIWGGLEDGLAGGDLGMAVSFGEELNLNSEGDARFVTFLFRNLKEFVEMRVEGQVDPVVRNMGEREELVGGEGVKAELKVEEGVEDKDRELVKSRRRARRLVLAQDNAHMLGKRFEKLAKKKSVKGEHFIDALDSRILFLKQHDRKNDSQIGEFVEFVKQRFRAKVKDVNIMELPVSSDFENAANQSLGKFTRKGRVLFDKNALDAAGKPIARNFFAEETNIDFDQEKSTDQTHETVARQLRGIDTFMSNVNESSVSTQDYLNNKTHDKPVIGRKLTITGGDHSHTKADALELSPNTIYEKMSEKSSTLRAAYPKMPKDFNDSSKVENGLREMRGLDKNGEKSDSEKTEDKKEDSEEKIEPSPERRLEEDKEDLTDKARLQIAISIVKQDLIELWNNGDVDG